MLLLVLLVVLTTTTSGDLHFSHFPLVSQRSDNLPLPAAHLHLSPTGRPGLLDQQDQRDHLLALLAAPGLPGGGDTGPEEGEERPRQKLNSHRLSWSRSRDKLNNHKLPEKKFNIQKRLRGGPGRNINSVDVEEKIDKPLLFRARPRARNRSGDRQPRGEQEARNHAEGQKIANRKKIIKKLKVQEGQKAENEVVETGKGLIQRRVRVKPQRKTLKSNVEAAPKVDADKVTARQFQRRLRPRLEEKKEESRGSVISSRLSILARSRTSNKDDIRGAAGVRTEYESEPQLAALQPGNSSSRPTIESFNIDPARTQHRKLSAPSDVSASLTAAATTQVPRSSVTEKDFRLAEERFLPTVRNLVSKKSRKRFRKIKTKNSKPGRRRVKGENDLIIDTAEFRAKQNLNLETTSRTTLVNLITTTTTTLINLITSTHPVAPAFRKYSRARGGVRTPELEEPTTTDPTERITTTSTTTTTTSTTTEPSSPSPSPTSPTPPTTTPTKPTTPTTATTTRTEPGLRVASTPNYEVGERTVYNPHKSRVSSRRNEIGGTLSDQQSHLTPLTYDLEKALKHAEITWAQDPFRKTTGLPGKPVFDIDFSKNPAAPASGPPLRRRPGPLSRRGNISANSRVSAPAPAPAEPQISSPSPSSDRSRKPLETILWTPEQLRALIQ